MNFKTTCFFGPTLKMVYLPPDFFEFFYFTLFFGFNQKQNLFVLCSILRHLRHRDEVEHRARAVAGEDGPGQ